MDQTEKLFAAFINQGASLSADIISLRRRLHQQPEIGFAEHKTTAALREEFKKLNLPIHDEGLKTGFWAQLDTGKPGPTIALRADIDALPVEEKTGLPFASKVKGKMHACGHDAHMAVIVGAARLLTQNRESLNGCIKFLCQPAEEVAPGGAELLIKAGVMKSPKIDGIVALHVDPSLPAGTIGLRDGIGMAATYDFDLIVTGKTAHAAKPHEGVDAIAVAAHIISGLQQTVSRMVDPITPVVITFGKIHGGTVRNCVAEEVVVEGTFRTLDPKLGKQLPRLIKKVAGDTARGFNAKARIKPIADYPVLDSNPEINEFIFNAYKRLFPQGKIYRFPEVLGGEDFARYLQYSPGAMFRLGVGNKKIGADKPWHSPQFILDEDAIPIGYITMAATAVNMLRGISYTSANGQPGKKSPADRSKNRPSKRPGRYRGRRSRPKNIGNKGEKNQ